MNPNNQIEHYDVPRKVVEIEQPVEQSNRADTSDSSDDFIWKEEENFFRIILDQLEHIRKTNIVNHKELQKLTEQATICLANIKMNLVKFKIYNILLLQDTDELVDLPEVSVSGTQDIKFLLEEMGIKMNTKSA